MTGFPKGIFFRKSIERFIKHKKNMNPVVINSQSIMQNICDKIVGSSVIFSYFTIKLSHKIFRNQQKSEKKMAGE